MTYMPEMAEPALIHLKFLAFFSAEFVQNAMRNFPCGMALLCTTLMFDRVTHNKYLIIPCVSSPSTGSGGSSNGSRIYGIWAFSGTISSSGQKNATPFSISANCPIRRGQFLYCPCRQKYQNSFSSGES